MIALPEWIDAELWDEYAQQRKKDKKAMSPRSERDRLARLYELKAAGHDPMVSLADALYHHWLDFYEPVDKSISRKVSPVPVDNYLAAQEAHRKTATRPPPEVLALVRRRQA